MRYADERMNTKSAASWEPTVRKMLSDAATRAVYEALEERDELATKLVRLRLDAGLTQAQVAARMGIPQSRVAQMESLAIAALPSLSSIRRYATACGTRVVIEFTPARKRRTKSGNGARKAAERPRIPYSAAR